MKSAMSEHTPPASYPDLAGKIVLVTGSSKALGAGTARAFGQQGAKVVVHGRDKNAIAAITEAMRAENIQCAGFAADVTQTTELARLRDNILSEFGVIDVLAVFAGGMGQPVSILDMDEALWKNSIDSDLTSKFLTVKTFLPDMKVRGSGNIILMSSAAGRLISLASAAYGAAETGTLMFMRHLAKEMGPYGIRVNAIAPSAVRNEKTWKSMTPEMEEKVASQFPLGRIGEPIDVAQAALFLASDVSSWITGHCLDVSGGKIML